MVHLQLLQDRRQMLLSGPTTLAKTVLDFLVDEVRGDYRSLADQGTPIGDLYFVALDWSAIMSGFNSLFGTATK